MKLTENELRGKTVMSEEGLYLGIMRNTTVDAKQASCETFLSNLQMISTQDFTT